MKWLIKAFKTSALRIGYTQIKIQSATVFGYVNSPYSILRKVKIGQNAVFERCVWFLKVDQTLEINNAFSVSTDVSNRLCCSYSYAQVKMQSSSSVVFFFLSDCIFSPLPEMVMVVDLIVSALRKFSGYVESRNVFSVVSKRFWVVVFLSASNRNNPKFDVTSLKTVVPCLDCYNM